ncbi:SRPBCC family protein [Ulvibacterium sp.]|uniref:SRPBCC family protein n=1 Tax=Ulvibacterium sp. TaxID=2665914 RepID=UPI003BA9CB5A
MKDSRHFIGAKTTKEEMYKAISEPQGLEKWWATSAKGDPKIGETIALHFENLTTLTFKYTAIVPYEKLELTCSEGPTPWQNAVLTFELEEREGQVFLTHTHSNIPSDDMASLTYFNTKWTVYLLSLKDYLETGKGTPYPTELKLYDGD